MSTRLTQLLSGTPGGNSSGLLGKVLKGTTRILGSALSPIGAILNSSTGLLITGFVILILFVFIAGRCSKPEPNPIVDVHQTPSAQPVINTEVVDNTDQVIHDNQQKADVVETKVDDTKKKIEVKTKKIVQQQGISSEERDKLIAEAEITELHDLYNELYK